MDNQIQSFKSLIEASQNILLVFPYVINSDACASVALMHKYLSQKNKKLTVGASRNIPIRFHSILNSCGINPANIIKEVKPVSYVVSVNDTKDSVDVTWEKKDDKIKFVLTPENQEIDFSKISFAKEGGVYDLVITFNSNRLDDLGNIYKQNRNQFSKYDIASLNFQSTSTNNFAKVTVDDKGLSTLSELTYELLKKVGYTLENSDAEILAEGLLGSTYGLHQAVDSRIYKVISELIEKHDIDPASINSKYFYSLTKKDLKLREKLLQNVKFNDSKKVIYSTLSEIEFKDLGLNPNDLDGMDYLPFNVCKGYDIAFFAYEYKNKSTVLIHSNNLDKDLTSILKKVSGYGNKLYGIILFSGNIDSSIQKTLNAIGQNSLNEEAKPERRDEAPKKLKNETSRPTFTNYRIEPQSTNKANVEEDSIESKAENLQDSEMPRSSYYVDSSIQSSRSSTNELDAEYSDVDIEEEIKPEKSSHQTYTPQLSESLNQTNTSQTSSTFSAPSQQSPFQKADDFVVDNEVDEYKKAQSFDSINRPFDRAEKENE